MLERALNDEEGHSIHIDDTLLAWSARRTVDIRMRGVRVLEPDGALRVEMPEAAISRGGRYCVA
jgi:hypothetical protein